jgi:SAM-dependent methyltransferase
MAVVPTSPRPAGRDDGPIDGYGPHSYGDAFADVYDDWYADVGDAQAAAAAVADLAGGVGGGPVLELGVGSGRVALPLAATGVAVWGVDASPAMLARLAERDTDRRVRGVEADMADPAAALAAAGAPAAFAVVVAAYNTFFLLTTEEAQRRCLTSAAALLAPGGAVVLECFVPGEPPGGVERVVEPRTVAADHVVLSVTTHDPAAQVVQGQHVELRESGTRLRPWIVRYATPAQLDELAGGVGLGLAERWSGWQREPFDDQASMHVSVYRRR